MTLREHLENFEPSETRAVLELIREKHPRPESQGRDVTTEYWLGVLREKVRRATDVNRLAWNLDVRELRGALRLLAPSEDELVSDRSLEILQTRCRADLLRHAWLQLVRQYPHIKLERFVRFAGSQIGWSALASDESETERFERWFGKESLPQGMLSEFIRTRWDDPDEWLQNREVAPDSSLRVHVWREIFTTAKKKLIRRVGDPLLLDHARLEDVAIQDIFMRRYLTELGGRTEWSTAVLEWIRGRRGVPQIGDSQTPFWLQIPKDVRDEYRRWANEKILREYFEEIRDPHGRFEFWQEFIDDIAEARIELGEVMLIDFGRFGVAEFANVGNAAYVYPAEHFVRIRRIRGNTVSDFKDRDATVRHPHGGPAFDGRIIHHGDWQSRYRPWIEDLIEGRV